MGGSQSSSRTPFNQSWHRRLVSLERLVRLAGEGRTREGRRKSIHARESRAMMQAKAAFKQVPQRSRALLGTEGRKRMRAERTWSRGCTPSERGRPVTGRGKEAMYAGTKGIYHDIWRRESCCRPRRPHKHSEATREDGHHPSSLPCGGRSDPSRRRTNSIHG